MAATWFNDLSTKLNKVKDSLPADLNQTLAKVKESMPDNILYSKAVDLEGEGHTIVREERQKKEESDAIVEDPTHEKERIEDPTQVKKNPTVDVEDPSSIEDPAMQKLKQLGDSFFTFATKATTVVTEQATKLKDQVEKTTILGDFQREQDSFANEKAQEQREVIGAQSDASHALLPWVDELGNENLDARKQILSLSLESRNFTRDPPPATDFIGNFDVATAFPVAEATLAADPQLRNMRFGLVPKQVKEDRFWRNYFYRVSLICQSMKLPTKFLVKQTTATSSEKQQTTAQVQPSTSQVTVTSPPSKEASSAPATEKRHDSAGGGAAEFISDEFETEVRNEDIEQVRSALGISSVEETPVKTEAPTKKEEDVNWEAELEAELQDYELITGGDVKGATPENEGSTELLDETGLEEELEEMLAAEGKK